MIAGAATAGTLGAGIKVYREEKRKKEFPWTVAAERMAKNKLSLVKGRRKSQFGAKPKMIDRVTFSIRRVQAKSASLREEIIAPFVSENRKGQLAEIGGNASDESPMEKESKRNLVVSSASLLCVSAGALFYAPLYVPGIAGILYSYSFLLKDAFYTIINERRANGNVLLSVVTMGALAGGFYFPMALAVWQGAIMRWLLAKTNNHSRKGLVNLLGEQPRSVWVAIDGGEVEIPFESLQIGDQVVVVALKAH